MSITVNPAQIDAYKAILLNPKDNGHKFAAIDKAFKKSATLVPLSTIFKDYAAHVSRPIPEVIFNIIFAEVHGSVTHDDQGNTGYHLTLKKLK